MPFYEIFAALCKQSNVKPSRAAEECGINRSNVSNWKNNGYTPRGDVLQKIAEYFSVPIDFLLERPPFDCWDEINQNRAGFLYYTGLSADLLRTIWGIDINKPNDTPVTDFIRFLSTAVASARPTEEGDWEIELRPGYQTEKAPTNDGERVISDAELKFALWGDCDDISDEDLADVRRYAAFVRERKKDQLK